MFKTGFALRQLFTIIVKMSREIRVIARMNPADILKMPLSVWYVIY